MSILFRLLTRIGALLRHDEPGTDIDGGHADTEHADGDGYLRSEHFADLTDTTDEYDTVDD